MKQNNKKFNNAMHKFVGVLDKYAAFMQFSSSIGKWEGFGRIFLKICKRGLLI